MRTCGACKHRRRRELEIALAEHKESYRCIAARFHLKEQCVRNHLKKHMPAALAKVAGTEIRDREALLHRIEENMRFVDKMRRSCDRYLQDPNDKELYDLGPRAEDIEVTYMVDNGEGHPTRQRALLSSLLEKVPDIFSVKYNMADPRELIIKAARAMNETLLLLGRVAEIVKPDAGATTNVQVNLFELMPFVYRILERHPIALKEVQEAVRASYGTGSDRSRLINERR